MIVRAVVLAAGAGARLGGVAKALLPGPGGSFLAAIVATAGRAGIAPADVVVVVGPPFGDAVAAAARALGAAVAVNPAPERGMASSVATGFAALCAAPRGDVALLWPVDHAAAGDAAVRAVLAAADGADVVVPRVGGRGGHPVAVARAAWPALAAAADAPDGARGVLRDPRWRRKDLALADPGLARDVDTPEDL